MVWALLLLAQEPMGDVLRRLRDDDPAARDAAAAALLERWSAWSDAELDLLRAAGSDPDVEVSTRARLSAERIELRRRLGALALAELPGADLDLARGGPDRRVAVLKNLAVLVELGRAPDVALLGVARFGAERRWAIPTAELLALARPAPRLLAPLLAEAVADKEALELLGRSGAVELFGRAAPRLAAAETRAAAIDVLGRCDARAHAEAVAKLLKHADAETRGAAAEALGRMGAVEHAEGVAALLAGADADLARVCAEALGRMASARHAEAVAALLGHEDAYARAEAAEALGRMGTGAAKLVRLLRDPESRVKTAAAEAIAAIGDLSVAPALEALLGEKDTSLLGFAAQILGRLGAKDRAEAIAALLSHNQPWTRAQAARALGRLGSLAQLGRLTELLDDEWDLVRTTAAIALGEMAELSWPPAARAEAVKRLRALAIGDAAGETRIAAASAALRLEGPDAALERRLLADVNPEDADAPGALLETLTRLREPEGREKLDREITLDAAVDSAASLKAAAAKAGLTLAWPEELRLSGRAPAGRTTLRRLLARFWDGAVPYLRGSELRPLPPTLALVEWVNR